MTTAITPNDSERIVIDSSGWLEYLTDDVNARQFAPYIEGEFVIMVPTVVIYEVYKKLLRQSGQNDR
jgi:toxin FitB